MRRGLTVCFLLAALAAGPAAPAAWEEHGDGAGAAGAATLPTGAVPAPIVSGSDVTLTWAARTLPDGTAVAGYVVRRYDAATGAEANVGGACDGIVTALTCTEANVASGTWVYTVTPAQAAWRGTASAKSDSIVVG